MRNLLMIFFSVLSLTAGASTKDWMIDASPYKAEVTQQNKDLVITNGLISRTIRLDGIGATISFNNMVTNEDILRSIRPEAEVTIDGNVIAVGGMLGQPIHNYLLPSWIDKMTADPDAMKLEATNVSEIGKRFDWKPRTEWMAVDPSWPPKGKEVVLTFGFDNEILQNIIKKYASDDSRTLLFEENFSTLSPQWRIKVSKSNTENLFINEGKPGEILVAANTAAYAELETPIETQVVIARIHPGTDKSSTWGPGVSWVFNNRTVKFNIRTSENKFGLYGVGVESEIKKDGVFLDKPVDLKMKRTGDEMECSYSYDNGSTWTKLYEFTLPANAKSKFVRVGKTNKPSSNGEMADKGESGRCQVLDVKLLGSLKNQPDIKEIEYLKDIKVNVHYEIYDGIPLLSKWISIENNSNREVVVNNYKSEILAAKEVENDAHTGTRMATPNITVETDFTHTSKPHPQYPERQTRWKNHVNWTNDPKYTTQIDWALRNPCLLVSQPQYGPEQELASGERFESHRIWELVHDTWERERRSLQTRKLFRTVAPWVAENPIFMHVRSADNESVKKAIDQCSEVGFEMVIMTFWSGVNIENPAPENHERMKFLADYAHSKGVALGGYSLLASRSINKDTDIIMPEGSGLAPTFRASPCLESKWGQQYFDNIYEYFKNTGQDVFEHDGSYPGDECASTSHIGHKGLEDSQWKQFKRIQKFYHWCKSQGIFLNVPDWYFLNGSNKIGMGYRETNWSLPREQQEILERQNIYDGTWRKTPSMGWMMVPLVEYHGGGPAATIEPLNEHLDHFGMRLANNFGAGVNAMYRGHQLYDTDKTKTLVKSWVDFYKKNRRILNADVIHLRRPDGTDWDGLLHVDPQGEIKGLAMLYNPLNEDIIRDIELPLYYTGISDKATVRIGNDKPKKMKLTRDYKVSLQVIIPARSCISIFID